MSAKAGGGVRGVRTYAGPGFNDPEFVEHVFSQWCLLTDFNLPAFDKWLNEQTDSPAIEELREKRAAAVAAFQLDPNDEAGILWHRDYLLARWQLLSRTSFLLPLARAGKAVDEARRKPKRPELQQWIDNAVAKSTGETAKELWARAPGWAKEQIGFDRFTKRVTAARKKEAGRK